MMSNNCVLKIGEMETLPFKMRREILETLARNNAQMGLYFKITCL